MGNGETIRFWADSWLPNSGPLDDWTLHGFPNDMLEHKAHEYVDSNINWAWNKIEQFLPREWKNKLYRMIPPCIQNPTDILAWGTSPDVCFFSSLAHAAIRDPEPNSISRFFSIIWQWDGPKRVRAFLWIAAHQVLMTNSERYRRHLALSPICAICGIHPESQFHNFRDSPKVSLARGHLC